jgi:hypothetical protein
MEGSYMSEALITKLQEKTNYRLLLKRGMQALISFVGIAALVAALVIVAAQFVPIIGEGTINFGDDFNVRLDNIFSQGIATALIAFIGLTFGFVVAVIAAVFALLVTVLALAFTVLLLMGTVAIFAAPIAVPVWIAYIVGRNKGRAPTIA